MSPSIQEIIKQLREAEGRATKGEWELRDVGLPYRIVCPAEKSTVESDSNADATLTVLMRNNLIPLLDYVADLERQLSDLKEGRLRCSVETFHEVIKNPPFLN